MRRYHLLRSRATANAGENKKESLFPTLLVILDFVSNIVADRKKQQMEKKHCFGDQRCHPKQSRICGVRSYRLLILVKNEMR